MYSHPAWLPAQFQQLQLRRVKPKSAARRIPSTQAETHTRQCSLRWAVRATRHLVSVAPEGGQSCRCCQTRLVVVFCPEWGAHACQCFLPAAALRRCCQPSWITFRLIHFR